MRAVALLTLLVLASCRDEPSFDERYRNAQQEVRKKAAGIDRELASDAPGNPAAR